MKHSVSQTFAKALEDLGAEVFSIDINPPAWGARINNPYLGLRLLESWQVGESARGTKIFNYESANLNGGCALVNDNIVRVPFLLDPAWKKRKLVAEELGFPLTLVLDFDAPKEREYEIIGFGIDYHKYLYSKSKGKYPFEPFTEAIFLEALRQPKWLLSTFPPHSMNSDFGVPDIVGIHLDTIDNSIATRGAIIDDLAYVKAFSQREANSFKYDMNCNSIVVEVKNNPSALNAASKQLEFKNDKRKYVHSKMFDKAFAAVPDLNRKHEQIPFIKTGIISFDSQGFWIKDDEGAPRSFPEKVKIIREEYLNLMRYTLLSNRNFGDIVKYFPFEQNMNFSEWLKNVIDPLDYGDIKNFVNTERSRRDIHGTPD